MFANKTFLITGCQGFLGKKLLENLVNHLNELQAKEESSSHHIYAIDNGITSSKVIQNYPEYVSLFDANAITFDYASLKTVDYVIHMAGLASPAQYKRYPLETIDVAVSLTRTLLEYSVIWKAKFLFFSSSEIYGNPDPSQVPTPESYKGYVSSMGPRSCYDESKRLGETLCYVFQQYFSVHTSIIRPFNIYGPGMSKHDYRMVPNLMRAAIEKKPIEIYGDGKQTRTFCFLEDAIDGIIRVLKYSNSGSAYNIGNPFPEISMVELVNMFNNATGSNVPYEFIEYPDHYPADEPLRRCPDISKAIRELNYKPKTELSKGLVNTFEWCCAHY